MIVILLLLAVLAVWVALGWLAGRALKLTGAAPPALIGFAIGCLFIAWIGATAQLLAVAARAMQ